MKIKKYCFCLIILMFSLSIYANPISFLLNRHTIHTISRNAQGLNANVLHLALQAYKNAKKQGITDKSILTIVDYSKPSYQPRMWVIDLNKNKVRFILHVAHGKNSGLKHPTSFSNQAKTHKSSLGLFLTGDIYTGKHGKSLHLHGLEEPFNNNAFKRSIVIHGAPYVTTEFINKTGRLGRSLGCMAINTKMLEPVINIIKDGTLIFAYYPDDNWLKNSKFF